MSREADDRHSRVGISPFDTPLSSGLRFAVEIIAWVAGPWAAIALTDGWWAAVPTLAILVAVPGVFSTPGDKRNVVVATPGPIRVLIELGLSAAAVAGAWIAWPTWAGVAATVIVLAALVAGIPRAKWLVAGAPSVGEPTG
jgi:hypothetical protein